MTGLYWRAYGAFISKLYCFLRLDDENQDDSNDDAQLDIYTSDPVVRSTLCVFAFVIIICWSASPKNISLNTLGHGFELLSSYADYNALLRKYNFQAISSKTTKIFRLPLYFNGFSLPRTNTTGPPSSRCI